MAGDVLNWELDERNNFGWAVDGALYLGIFLMWAAILLTVYSGAEYIIKASRILRTEP